MTPQCAGMHLWLFLFMVALELVENSECWYNPRTRTCTALCRFAERNVKKLESQLGTIRHILNDDNLRGYRGGCDPAA